MQRHNIPVVFILLSALLSLVLGGTPEECKKWAEQGECDVNPDYMWEHCEEECEAIEEAEEALIEASTTRSFYDLKAKDINGAEVDFAQFRGKAVVVVNVASYCGYTEQHYRELVELHSDLLKETKSVEIMAFPCNQFGEQEPESHPKILEFAQKKGVEFLMMEKIDVNGKNTHPVYLYLKKADGPSRIEWNFATYYIVSPDGTVESFSDVEPSELYDEVLDTFEQEL